ncbi:MAG: hypothetical protein U1E13_14635, partial [Methylophilaceae bacterium]|nr:hypothetical protein [Methylophilaceae bacterium]
QVHLIKELALARPLGLALESAIAQAHLFHGVNIACLVPAGRFCRVSLGAFLQSSAPSISAGLLSGGAGGIGFSGWGAIARTGMMARALPSSGGGGGKSGGGRSGGDGTTSPSRLARASTAAGRGAAATVRTA